MRPTPPLRRIVLATDLGAASETLFAHGLRLALLARAQLYLVHIDQDDADDATWRRLPTVRTLLERWGEIGTDAAYADFESLGVKVHALGRHAEGDLRSALAARVALLQPDLLILGTHARTGFARLVAPSVAEPVARDVHKATLFVGAKARGVVDAQSGGLRLSRVLVPVSGDTDSSVLLEQLARLLDSIEATDVSFVLLHIGDQASMPTPTLPTRPNWRWKSELRSGFVVEQIMQAEVAHDVDMIAMATHGHDSVLDAVRGSTMERVLRLARSPVYAVPV